MLGIGFKESVADSIIFYYFGYRLQATGFRVQATGCPRMLGSLLGCHSREGGNPGSLDNVINLMYIIKSDN